MGTVFYCNRNYCKQLDGVAMGSCLGPVFSNAFSCYHERTGLNTVQLHMLRFFIGNT